MMVSQRSPLFKLSVMMFLQYAIWGAWLPLFFSYLTGHLGIKPQDAGWLFSIGAIGALLAPFIAGQIADRWFNTEKFLALSHFLGALLVWRLASVKTWPELAIYGLLYSLVYAPTLALTNSLAFHHLRDRDREFGKVRVWGTVGWIVAGIAVAQWLFHHYSSETRMAGMADSLRLSAILGVVMGFYCLLLPKTPPRPGKEPFAASEALKEIGRRKELVVLFLVAFPIACIHQFYFVLTAPFINSLKIDASWINNIFGVGGGGLMTIGQISELVVLALIPIFAKRFPRKTFLVVGLVAYALRFLVFAYLPTPAWVIPALALHGVCFGCFFFMCFMIVDELTTKDVRASAQGLFNLVIVGLGTIVGNLFAGYVAKIATRADTTLDFKLLFSVPLVVAFFCLAALMAFYPRRAAGTDVPETAAVPNA